MDNIITRPAHGSLCQQITLLSTFLTGALTVVGADTPFTWNEAVLQTLSHHPQLHQMEARTHQAQGRLQWVHAQGLSRIQWVNRSSEADQHLMDSPITGLEIETVQWNSSLRWSRDLWTGGRQSAEEARAKNTISASELEAQSTALNLLRDLGITWSELEWARDECIARQEALERAREHLVWTHQRFENGKAIALDVARAEYTLADAEPALIAAELTYHDAMDRLWQLTGASGSGRLLDPDFATAPWRVHTPKWDTTDGDWAEQEALANRVELLVVELQRESAAEGRKIAAASRKPTIRAEGGYSLQSSRYREWDDRPLHGWDAAITLNWSLVDGGKTKGHIHEAEAEISEIESLRLDTETRIRLEVRQARNRLKLAETQLAALDKLEAEAALAYNIAKERLEAGAAIQLEVLDAELKVTRARVQRAQSNHVHRIAGILWWHAIGQLWWLV